MRGIVPMEQRKSYTPRHAASCVNRQQASPQVQRTRDDPNLQVQIRRYQAKKRRKRAKRRRVIRRLLVLVLLVLFIVAVVMIAKGLCRDELKGVWALDQTTVYEFDGRGSGTLHLPLGDYAFSYAIEDKQLTIDFSDERAADAIYRFSIDSSVLTLDSDNGSVFRLERRK